MCKRPSNDQPIQTAYAYWRKENWPKESMIIFACEAKRCKCGKKWFVRLPNKPNWHEAEKDDETKTLDV